MNDNVTDASVPSEGGSGTIRLNEPGPGGGSPPEGEGRRIDDIRVIGDWVYFDLDGWQTPGLPVEKLLRNAPERLFRWLPNEDEDAEGDGSVLDRLLDIPGSVIRSDAELEFVERKIDEYLRLRRRMLADRVEAAIEADRQAALEAEGDDDDDE